MWDKVNVQRGSYAIAARHQIPSDHDGEHVAQPAADALTIDGALGEQRRQNPDDKKNDPASADNVFCERIHGRSHLVAALHDRRSLSFPSVRPGDHTARLEDRGATTYVS